MLLNELTGVKRFYGKSQFQIERILAKFGIKVVAAGKYGTVFTSPKWDYVVKMFKNDPHYLDFVNYAIAHPNKHYPKFVRKPLQMHAFAQRDKSQSAQKFWLVKIEKLKEIDKAKANLIIHCIDRCAQYMHQKANFDKLTDWQKQGFENDWTWATGPDGKDVRMTMADFIELYPWLATLAEAWYKIFQNVEEGSPDLHAGNFMQREDGTVVIIDPLWVGSNPNREYQEWLATETDAYAYQEDEPQVRGPAYIQKREQAAVEATRSFAQELYDDDIPF